MLNRIFHQLGEIDNGNCYANNDEKAKYVLGFVKRIADEKAFRIIFEDLRN